MNILILGKGYIGSKLNSYFNNNDHLKTFFVLNQN